MKRGIVVFALILACLIASVGALAQTKNPSSAYALEPPVAKDYALPYTLTVYLSHQVVVAYDAKTGDPVRYMLCSSGKGSTPTIRGTFTMPSYPAYSFMAFPGCYVRYPTKIKGGYYFHSILFRSRTASSYTLESWNALGRRASHGCVRLTPLDAQWVNYNCDKGTRVRIVDASVEGMNTIREQIRRSLRYEDVQPTLQPTPTPIPPALYEDDKKSRVKIVQSYLFSRGFYAGKSDGKFTGATFEAWKDYEKAASQAGLHVVADGVATPEEQYILATDKENVGYKRTLKNGNTGYIVQAIETRLKQLGYFTPTPDTKYNATTAAAVKQFQLVARLSANGKAAPDTQARLFAAAAPTPTPPPPLKRGSKGARVTNIQKRLYQLGFLRVKSNGKFTASTEVAVHAYQSAVGLTQTGTVDTALYDRIMTDNSVVGAKRPLSIGATGVVVLALEQKLVDLQFFTGTPNTKYDKVTAAAVRLYQKANGMTANGKASSALLTKIFGLA